MIRMIFANSDLMLIILFVSGISSFLSPKFGIFTCWLVTILSIAFTAIMVVGGVTGIVNFLLLGLLIFPALSWLGYIVGKQFKKKSEAKLDKNLDPE